MPDLLDAARRVVESSRWDDPDNHPPGTRPAPDRKAVDDLEAALDAYEWSDEPPEEPGYYWYANPRHARTILCVFEHNGELMVETSDGVISHPEAYDGEWAGPIPEPTDTE